MTRILLIIIVLYLLWRIFKSIKILFIKKNTKINKNRFDHIEDAEFEDITDKNNNV